MPVSWERATEIYARDAFLVALDNDDLRRRIMLACPPPETLSAVFDLAVRASAADGISTTSATIGEMSATSATVGDKSAPSATVGDDRRHLRLIHADSFSAVVSIRKQLIMSSTYKCDFCNHDEFRNIYAFRRHVIRNHDVYCNYRGEIRPFIDEAEKQRMKDVIARSGGHRNRTPAAIIYRLSAEGSSSDLHTVVNQTEPVTVDLPSVPISLPPGNAVDLNADPDFALWNALLGPSFGDPVPAVPESSEHPTVTETAVQAVVDIRAKSVQTPGDGAVLLPPEWPVHRLIELAGRQPSKSARQLALEVSRESPAGLPAAQLDIIELVLGTFVRSTDYLIDRFQCSRRRMEQGDDQAPGEFNVWLTEMQQRPRSCYGPLFGEPTAD